MNRQDLLSTPYLDVEKVLNPGSVRNLFRALALTLGGLHTWAAVTSQSMNADGINYLDIGDAYLRSDWALAINDVWSPMYSWILGVVMKLASPSMAWEFPTVHLVNFVIYVAALACFEHFWGRLWQYLRGRTRDQGAQSPARFPEWAWLGLGYSLFITASLVLIEIWSVTPDMLMSAFVYLAAAQIVSLRLGDLRYRTFLLLGIILGLGYLAKAIMLPIGLVFLLVALVTPRGLRHTAPRTLAALAGFVAVAGPFLALVSVREGRLSFGDAGVLTYVRYVNGVTYPHWQGARPGDGTPLHPSRQILDSPPVFEFASPVGGTYPISMDPSYWYEGVVPKIDLRNQLAYLEISALFFFDLLFRQQAGLALGVTLLYLAGRHSMKGIDSPARWGLLLPALAAFGFYAAVNVAGRYVGVFVVLFWADLLANIPPSQAKPYRRQTKLTAGLMILMLMANLLAFNLEGYLDLTGRPVEGIQREATMRAPSWPGEVAQAVLELGLQPGDPVAVIGYGFDAFWARLARVQIIAELLHEDAGPFWTGTPEEQDAVLEALADTGARVVVAEYVPEYAKLHGWRQIADTNHFLYLLDD